MGIYEKKFSHFAYVRERKPLLVPIVLSYCPFLSNFSS